MRLESAVLVDTGPIYALLDSHDHSHGRARELFERVNRSELQVNVCYLNLLEIHRLLLIRLGKDSRRAYEVVKRFADQVVVRYPSEADGRAALQLLGSGEIDSRAVLEHLKNYETKNISLTDATIAVMAIRLKMRVATFNPGPLLLSGAQTFDDYAVRLDDLWTRPE